MYLQTPASSFPLSFFPNSGIFCAWWSNLRWPFDVPNAINWSGIFCSMITSLGINHPVIAAQGVSVGRERGPQRVTERKREREKPLDLSFTLWVWTRFLIDYPLVLKQRLVNNIIELPNLSVQVIFFFFKGVWFLILWGDKNRKKVGGNVSWWRLRGR